MNHNWILNWYWAGSLGFLSFLALGCNAPPADAPTEPASETIEAVDSPDAADPAADQITVNSANVEQYQQLVDSHQGKVVLVDFWATWCPPCKMQFPHTVKLSHAHKDDGLAVISVSFDDPEAKEDVLAFLRKQNADFENLMSEFGSGVDSPEKFDIAGGAVPFYKLYDRSGKLRHEFSGDPEGIEGTEPIDTIDARVAELLAESSSN